MPGPSDVATSRLSIDVCGDANPGHVVLGERGPLASLVMFTRLNWFAARSAATIGAGIYVGAKVKQARERITPETMARAGVSTAAGMMGAVGRRMQGSGAVVETTPPTEEPGSVEPRSD